MCIRDSSRVYYDYLKTPVQINNRLAILTANNPFLLNFMGIRYLETSPSQVPAGYRVLWENDTMAVSENESVLPVAYLTSDTMTDTLFNRIKGWEQAEALTRTTVIPDEAADSSTISGKASSEKEEGWRTKIDVYKRQIQGLSIFFTVTMTGRIPFSCAAAFRTVPPCSLQ